MKIFLTSKDLHLKTNVRPKYYEVFGLRAACIDEIPSDNPFARHKGMKIFVRKLAKKILEIGGITYFQYLIMIFGQHTKEIIDSLKLIIKGSVKIKALKEVTVESGYYSVSLERSYPHVFGDIFVVDCYNDRINIDVSLLIKSIMIMFKYQIFSLFHAIQYLQVEKSIKLINKNNSTFIIEEGINSFVTYVMFCNKQMGCKVIVTQKQVATECPPAKYYSTLYSSNVITNNINLNHNRNSIHVEFESEINLNAIKRDQKNIGYAVDMGTLFLNKNDKDLYDSAMNKISSKQDIGFIYSIHPQEREQKKEFYQKRFNSALARYRGDNSIEEFFSEIDILIVWWSTLVSQAIICGKFVILLDFFDDRQGMDLENFVPKVVKRVKNKNELVDCISDLRSIPIDIREQYFLESNSKLFKPPSAGNQ